ncbi:MAG TPA: helix-turn-helix domain-containing protein [Streptosporangiaceae bacterium]|nr:helix-turn-helix domain-containing protein [Streptosporangiaceae bacterium]
MRAANRDRLLQAAAAAFATEGLSVPLDEMARRAGVGPGTLYRHFPAKEALFEAVLRFEIGQLLARAQRSGTIRDDITTADLVALIRGILFAIQARSGDHADPQRAVAVLRDGLQVTKA